MRSDIERFVEGITVTIQMWIASISYSNRSAAVIAEAIEVDSKPFESFFPFKVSVTCACMNKLHCIPCLLFVLKIVRVINFCGFHYPRKIFNNEIFPDYDTSEPLQIACDEQEFHIDEILICNALRKALEKNESLQSTCSSQGTMKLTPLCEPTNSL